MHCAIRAAQQLVGALDRAGYDAAMDGQYVGEEGHIKGSRNPNNSHFNILVTRGPPMNQAAICCPPGHAIEEAAQGGPICALKASLELHHEVGGDGGHIR